MGLESESLSWNHDNLLASNSIIKLLYNRITPILQVGRNYMQVIDRFMMLSVAVSDMPKAKAFYADKLGLKITTDYRQDDGNWWVSLAFPEDEVSITLSTNHENMKPGTMKVYFAASDIEGAHKELHDKGVKVNDIQDNLFGPGSGVRWFSLADPDGNQVLLAQL